MNSGTALSRDDRYRRVQRLLWVILVLNLVVAAAKGVAGLAAGSVSMVADAFHSGFDSLSNVIGIVSVHIARIPPDEKHPYGHGKFETAGTLLIGVMLIVTALSVFSEGAHRLVAGAVPHITTLTVTVLVATVAINLGVAWFEDRVGRRLNSQILIADSRHTRSDVFVSLSVIGGFALVELGFPQVDPLLAFVIGALIGKMGISLVRSSGRVLTDALTVECEETVARIIDGMDEVRGYHQFRCRGKPDELFADIHIGVDPSLTVDEGHDIARRVRDALITGIDGMEDVVVHIEPEEQTD
ncbi:MAG: cation diffusion facilitator family transporter [Methanomicrobiales archaeon]